MKRIALAAAGLLALLLAWKHPAAQPAVPAVAQIPSPQFVRSRARHPQAAHGGEAAVVYVAGAVMHPGLYALPENARIDDAVRRAGGMRADADPDAVNLAEHVSDGEEIRVVRAGEPTPRPARKSRHRKKARKTFAAVVDLNTADAQTLVQVPGIGDLLAERIVEYRRINGPFASIDELADVSGMTQSRVDALAPFLSVHEGQQ